MENISQNINFDEIYKIMIFAMRLNRSHPDISRDRKWVCQFVVMHGLFSLFFSLLMNSLIFYDIKKGDFITACANAILGIIFLVVTYKYCVMLRYQNQLKSLMEEMRMDYETSKSFSLIEQQIILNYAKRGIKVVDLWLIITIVCGSLLGVKSLFRMISYSIKGDFQLVPLCDLTYPSPIEEMKNEPVTYFLLSILFLFYDCYAMLMYIAMAALGPVFMLHGCGQLKLVKGRIMNIFKENDSEKLTLEKLCDIIKHLQKIYSFVERVQESFKILYELTLKISTIALSIIFYQVLQSYQDGDFRIEFIAICIGVIALTSIPCYYSDLLMDMGENVRLAMYMCGWEAHLEKHRGFRTTLLIIHARAARAIAIRTMFRNVSLDALTDVYHQSYAIFNVLNASSH